MRRYSRPFKMASEGVRDGIFALNKPCGRSSADMVRECSRAFNPSLYFKPMIDAQVTSRLKNNGGKFQHNREAKNANAVKIGHGGTLDPLATGVLVVGVGNGTKQLTQFLECTKTYEAVVLFGASTDTYDRVGRLINKRPYEQITRQAVEDALESFRGKTTQIPPLFSALKMDGKPLYEYARSGKPIPREIKGREIEAFDIEILEWYEPGTHDHRWPTAEADALERDVAEQVWKLKKQQEEAKPLTPEEKEQDDQAIAAHESFKKKFEERQDELIVDRRPTKKEKRKAKKEAMMSGALGSLPEPRYSRRGEGLIEPPPDPSLPPPWTDKGPPAVKIRLTVSGGYYVRSFCHDLGTKVGSAAFMVELCRTRVSDFHVNGTNCLEYDDLKKGEDTWGPQLADMLARWNGEPAGVWPPKQAGQKQKPNPQAGDKRQRSASPTGESSKDSMDASSPPRKVAATAPASASKPTTTPSGSQRAESEKSWNGIED
jgi:tRNA pseudouridine55 synthase